MASFVDRMIGAATLNIQTYEEVEADVSATGQAMAVVLLSSIAHGIGNIGHGGFGLMRATIFALVGWVVWASLAYIIGTKLMPEPQTRSSVGELLRTTGFSASPGVLAVLGIIPVLGRIILFVITIWMLVTMVIAVRQALDYQSMGRAVVVCLIGFVVYLILSAVLLPFSLLTF
jgi:hypothetical protein